MKPGKTAETVVARRWWRCAIFPRLYGGEVLSSDDEALVVFDGSGHSQPLGEQLVG